MFKRMKAIWVFLSSAQKAVCWKALSQRNGAQWALTTKIIRIKSMGFVPTRPIFSALNISRFLRLPGQKCMKLPRKRSISTEWDLSGFSWDTAIFLGKMKRSWFNSRRRASDIQPLWWSTRFFTFFPYPVISSFYLLLFFVGQCLKLLLVRPSFLFELFAESIITDF